MSKVVCDVCSRFCVLSPGQRGACLVRENQNGKIVSLVYGRPCSINVDPIEKKPLFHFLPGTQIYSVATAGCNFHCKFCQNWQIARSSPEDVPSITLSPKQLVADVKRLGADAVAFTYTDPIAFYEYMYDIAVLCKEQNIPTVAITNGYYTKRTLKELCAQLSAIKVDLKSFSEKFYMEICGGVHLKVVLDNLVSIKKFNTWLEIVVLVIPTLNDSEKEIRELSQWVVINLGNDVPVHFTRFHPTYKLMNLPPTPLATIERSCEIAKAEGLLYVYGGNVSESKLENTYCPDCQKLLIKRSGFFMEANYINNSCCPHCQKKISGIF